MLRFCFSFVVVLMIFSFSSFFVLAQEKPLQETSEIIALTTELRQLLEPLPNNEKIPILFRLLSIEIRFADKQPAQNTIRQVLALVSSVEKESIQAQILEAVAMTQAILGDYEQSVKTLDLIAKPSVRAEKQLIVAEKIIEDIENSDTNKNDTEKNNADKNETINRFDVTDLLRKSLAGTIEAKDAALESLVSIILARELAKQGKIDESKNLFEKARKKAREVEEIEERNLVALMIHSLITVNQQSEALALIETITDEENKMLLLGQAAITLAQEGKITEAINLVKVIKQNEIKLNTISKIVQDTAKTITVEQILELRQIISPEFHNLFLQNTFNALPENKRDDIMVELIKHLENVTENRIVFQYYHLKLLIDTKKFEEAAQFIKTLNTDLKSPATQYLFTRIVEQQGEVTEELLNLISETYSEEEKQEIKQVQMEIENVLKNNNPEEQWTGLIKVFQSQNQLFDPHGLKKTLELLFDAAEKLNDPCVIVQNRLGAVDMQIQLYDKSGVKDNLKRLQQFLDGIKDVSVFKDLFPDESAQSAPVVSETTTQPVLRLNSSTDETTGNDKLFLIYCSITLSWYVIDEKEEAKKSFQKAQSLANAEPDALRKIEKLFMLSDLLVQMQSGKP
ncbi:MAG: hypothetical protein LBP87_12010 [Planctomycetaceae bacterium]|jgi:tetratricopeptide (TPR) repeat protein|nr:hypothetical protein [Planctomycetaceae bacterium]